MSETEKGVSVKAVAFGLMVYLIGVVLVGATGVLFVAFNAYNAAQRGASQQQIAEQLWRAPNASSLLWTCFAVAVVFTALGGYVAARAGRRAFLVHALPVGLLSLFAGILFTLFSPFPVPTWFLPIALALPVPLALAGGYLGSLSWLPVLAELPDEDEAAAEADVETARDARENAFQRAQIEQLMLKNLKRQQQQAESVGQLVQQRRERELEHRQRTIETEKQEALAQALEQSKVEACEDMREIVRKAFMSHPAATEEDFERCWPDIRDEMFKQYALDAYNSQASRNQGNI
ncbi:MAG TPA: hypothetical protein VNA19_01425 [Pyrinomonadaceae bacterium]|nr:hypothetical protein [Pyrinomonadaceae bacterium]